MTDLTVLASKNTAIIHLRSMKMFFSLTGQMPTQLRANLCTDNVTVIMSLWKSIPNPRTTVASMQSSY